MGEWAEAPKVPAMRSIVGKVLEGGAASQANQVRFALQPIAPHAIFGATYRNFQKYPGGEDEKLSEPIYRWPLGRE